MAQFFTKKVVAGAVVVYAAGVGASYMFLNRKPSPIPLPPPNTGATSGTAGEGGSSIDVARCNSIAAYYDREIDTDELVMGLKLVRRYIASQAKGQVLEVGAGTGRNVTYLHNNPKCRHVTLTDASPGMLEQARFKLHNLGYQLPPVSSNEVQETDKTDTNNDITDTTGSIVPIVAGKTQDKFELRVQDSSNMADVPGQSMDTVLQTFGLCSCEDPSKVLRECARVCKPDGELLFIEHGKSHYDWLNRILQSNAERHHERWGCWWNRDIEDIFAEVSDVLQVTSMTRIHFGTTYIVRARPRKLIENHKK